MSVFHITCGSGHAWPWGRVCGNCTYVSQQYPDAAKRYSRVLHACHYLTTREADWVLERIKEALRGDTGKMHDGSPILDWVLNRNEIKGDYEMACVRYCLLGEHPGVDRKPVVERNPDLEYEDKPCAGGCGKMLWTMRCRARICYDCRRREEDRLQAEAWERAKRAAATGMRFRDGRRGTDGIPGPSDWRY